MTQGVFLQILPIWCLVNCGRKRDIEIESDQDEFYSTNADDTDEWKPTKDVHTAEKAHESECSQKKRKVQKDLSNRFPSRPTLRRCLQTK